jgi:hypothetical protein
MTKERDIANQMHRLLRLAEEALRNCKMIAEQTLWSDTGPMSQTEVTIRDIVDRYFEDRIAEQKKIGSRPGEAAKPKLEHRTKPLSLTADD